jgi:hypothetical protein
MDYIEENNPEISRKGTDPAREYWVDALGDSVWKDSKDFRLTSTIEVSHQCPREEQWSDRNVRNLLFKLVGRARFELATNGLKVRCSTG